MSKVAGILENSEKLLAHIAAASESMLSELVLYHNRKYFEDNDPEITDEAFDKLVEALRFKNPKARALNKIGHRDDVHALEKFGKEVVHNEPMLSLEKCYDDATFFKWAAKITGDFVAMPKIDGVACSIIYDDAGKLIEASTRGDGRAGEDITKNALLIPDLPSVLSPALIENAAGPGRGIEVRGEVFLPLSYFNEKFAEDFVNPRNLAAGVLKLKEGDRTKNNFLRFFPYDVRGTNFDTETDKFALLKQLGFSMMPWSAIKNDSEALGVYMRILQQRATLDFEIDGVVFRANSQSDQRRLGETAHHPRYALAYKFQGESAQTKLVRVEWSVARSGMVTPVAIVEPVFVSGASITRASLHNVGIFLALDLREESLVEINRRGGVIPHLERVLSRRGAQLLPPETCPSCESSLVVDGDFLRCVNPGCSKVEVQRLVHFCHVIGIEGMGEKIVRKLFEAGMFLRFGDIFRLKANELATLERMGDVLATKIVAEISRMRTIDLPVFIRALGIEEIGGTISELVAANFHSLSAIRGLTVDDLLPVHGIGDSIASALVSGLASLAEEIDDLLTEVTVNDQAGPAVDADQTHPLFGKSVLFTGKMAHLERKAAQDAVKRAGGKAPSAMSHAVDFLVIGDEGSPLLGDGKKSTKQKEAEKLVQEGHAIKIISETDFLKLLKR